METKFEDGQKTTSGPLIKIIKANLPLSVQVHPDDEMAKQIEGKENGKSESWYILDCEPKSELVLGLKTYNKDIIKKSISENNFEHLLKTVTPQKGMFVNIPAGLVHGLGGGITVFEVQQPSDITYRYFDYNRLENGKPRELHIEKALAAQKDTSFSLQPFSLMPLTFINDTGKQIFTSGETKVNAKTLVIDFEAFTAYIAENEIINFNTYALIPLE